MKIKPMFEIKETDDPDVLLVRPLMSHDEMLDQLAEFFGMTRAEVDREYAEIERRGRARHDSL